MGPTGGVSSTQLASLSPKPQLLRPPCLFLLLGKGHVSPRTHSRALYSGFYNQINSGVISSIPPASRRDS